LASWAVSQSLAYLFFRRNEGRCTPLNIPKPNFFLPESEDCNLVGSRFFISLDALAAFLGLLSIFLFSD